MKSKFGLVALAIIAVLLIAGATVGCGIAKEKFTCGWCCQAVYEKPHHARILGQEVKLCNECYKGIKNLQTKLYD